MSVERRHAVVGLVGLCLVALAGCTGSSARWSDWGAGSAVSAAPSERAAAVAASPGALAALDAAGVDSWFVVAGAVGERGELERAPIAPPPRGFAVVLVVRTAWSLLAKLSRREVRGLADELALLALEWEGVRSAVRGIHLMPAGELEDPEAVARVIGALARALPRGSPLSLHLDAARLDDHESLGALAASVPRLVVEVYGQAASEEDRPDLWDLEPALERARRAELLGRPFLASIALSGRVLAADGARVVARGLSTTVLARGRVTTDGVFVYRGFHRQLLDLRFDLPTKALGLDGEPVELPAGEVVRLARPTPQHLEVLAERLAALGLGHLEGTLWSQARPAGDAVAVALERLPAVLAGEAGSALRAELRPVTGGMELTLRNEGDPTGWATREHNYLEVDLDGGRFGDPQLGEFARVELSRRGSDAAPNSIEAVRSADRMRLYFVQLDGGAVLGTGTIPVRGGSAWSATMSAEALSPTGEIRTFDDRALRAEPEPAPAAPEGREAGRR